MYKLTSLLSEYTYLCKECALILKHYNLVMSDAVEISFIYNDQMKNEVNKFLTNNEKHMYYICKKNDEVRTYYTLKLPITWDAYKFSYLVIYFESFCIIARYGIGEDKSGTPVLNYFFLNDKKIYYYKDVNKIDNEEIRNLILSKFCRINLV